MNSASSTEPSRSRLTGEERLLQPVEDNLAPENDVLDVGCGDGRLALRLALLTDAVVEEVRRLVAAEGPEALRIDDLTSADLELIGWSGSPMHIVSVGKALDRVASGEVEYLVVRAPSGQPVCKGGIDYATGEGAGTMWQLATAHQLQGLGLATQLIHAAEERIRARGLSIVELGVEDNNPRARSLYQHLGYDEVRREYATWNTEDASGSVTLYETELAVLQKPL